MSTDAQAEAIKALLTTATKVPWYDHDEAQALGATLPATYGMVYLSRRFGDEPRRDGMQENNLRRLQTRVASKSITNARLIEDRVAEAFNLRSLTIDGALVHLAYESGGGVFELDEGFYTDLASWTYAV